jgi:hypothetical protein
VIVAIHQPNFLPWLGYFYKMAKCDVFVLLDDVQYTKNGYINRNKIKTPKGEQWLTVPVSFRFGEPISAVSINQSADWRSTHLKTLEGNYRKALCFDQVFCQLKDIYYSQDWLSLSAFNIELIHLVASWFRIETRVVKASDLFVDGVSTTRLVNIIKAVGGDGYLSGHGAVKYQDEAMFKEAQIALLYTEFTHPVYRQPWGAFLPNLSAVDLAFNVAPPDVMDTL